MAQWVGTTSESGILRKNKPKDNHDDLFVFGYACKLFRDDEKAQYIDQGKHLIPWMGDDNLKIDRYDGRGALSDIKPYEASREGYDTMRWLGLNESERKIEQLCDKERYYALEINEEEEKMYREEEEKRQKANQFQYSYDVPEQPTQQQQQQQQEIGPTARDNDDDGDGGGVFVPPPQLDIPVDIEIPTTVKENARIEKTASFVHKQGPQMEILIKAKQADNPQFGFLNQGHRLYKYYRHILSAIKNGLYQVNSTISNKNDTKKDEDNGDNNTNDDHYLHPSLLSTTTVNVDDHVDDVHVDVQTSSIPTLPYKPSANCAYSQLVNRIQGSLNEQQQQQQQQLIQTTTTMVDNKNVPPKNQEAYSQLTYEQQQYYQYYYIAQYYEYYKQLAQYQQNGGQQVQPPEMHLDPSIQNYIQQMAYTQYLQQQQQQQTTNPYAQIVNNLSNLTNQQQQQQQESSTTTIEETRIVTNLSPKQQIKDDTEFKKPLLSLAQYGSDSDNDNNDNTDNTDIDNSVNYKIPIGEIRIVIDKMASYVAKNGKQFEEIVKAKGDPRFEFLNETHDYYQYYRNKIKESTNNNNNNNSDKREVKIVPIMPQKLKENRKIIAPVSFSIKKPKDDGPKEIKSALPIEESDDETTIENQVIIEKNDDHLNNTVIPTIPIEINNSSNNNSSSNNSNNNDSEGGNNGGIFDTDDPILEMIDLTDDLDDQKRDIKRAEDKIKDKLAMAAREKLVSVNRDNRALQLERKRKAAAFLALKSAENQNITNDENIIKSTPNISGGGGGSRVADLQQPIKDRSSDDNDDDLDDCGDNGDQDGDNRRFQRKKKSHKRKHSKSKHDSKSRKKSKKKRRRSSSDTSTNSRSS